MPIHTLIHLNETGSTNSYAIELLSRSHPDEGTVIIADHQTSGKGMDSNTWESEAGKNLTFSLIIYPGFTADKQFLLNKALALGIYDFLCRELPNQKVSIKWPNDIYIADQKACGLLIQNSVTGNRFEHVVAGIGLNVNQTLFVSDAPNPVSLKMISGKQYDLDLVLKQLLNSISSRYSTLKPGAERKIEIDYQAALYRLLEWHDYMVKSTMMKARITGTNEYGQLILETSEAQVMACDVKEVRFTF